MKKILLIILILLTCCSCSSNKVHYRYDIQTRNVDMSKYDGISSTNHMFKAITVQELFNCIDNKSSGVFYIGRSNCQCCQLTLKYLNEVALKDNVTIYYIDVYDEMMPLDNQEICDKLESYIDPIVEEIDGKKELQTPTIFSVVNGVIYDHIICLANYPWDNANPKASQINRLEKKYHKILKPFI